MEITDRLGIYIWLLNCHLKDKDESIKSGKKQIGLCVFLKSIVVSGLPELKIEFLDELYRGRPKNKFIKGLWWSDNPNDNNREIYLRKAIVEAKSKIK